MTVGWIFPLAVPCFAGAVAGIAMIATIDSMIDFTMRQKYLCRPKHGLLRPRILWQRQNRALQICYQGGQGEPSAVSLAACMHSLL